MCGALYGDLELKLGQGVGMCWAQRHACRLWLGLRSQVHSGRGGNTGVKGHEAVRRIFVETSRPSGSGWITGKKRWRRLVNAEGSSSNCSHGNPFLGGLIYLHLQGLKHDRRNFWGGGGVRKASLVSTKNWENSNRWIHVGCKHSWREAPGNTPPAFLRRWKRRLWSVWRRHDKHATSCPWPYVSVNIASTAERLTSCDHGARRFRLRQSSASWHHYWQRKWTNKSALLG